MHLRAQISRPHTECLDLGEILLHEVEPTQQVPRHLSDPESAREIPGGAGAPGQLDGALTHLDHPGGHQVVPEEKGSPEQDLGPQEPLVSQSLRHRNGSIRTIEPCLEIIAQGMRMGRGTKEPAVPGAGSLLYDADSAGHDFQGFAAAIGPNELIGHTRANSTDDVTVARSLEKQKRPLPVLGGLVPMAQRPAGRPALVEDLGFNLRAAVFQKRKGAIEKVWRFVRSTRSERVVAREYQVLDRLLWVGTWRKVRANKGTHGIDRVTIRMFESDLDTHLREIQRKLKEHRFEPQPVLRVYIPKPADPKKRRPLGIPVVTDRIVQQAIVQVVEPLFDDKMSPRSFGYRKGRKARDAIATIIQDAKEGFRVVLDADIASFFDTLAHEVVMSRVRARIADGRVLDLIEAFLKAGISENNVVTVPTEGTPQGGVISPWLSNLVLDDLDKALESRQWRHVRYADDFVVLCRSREEAQDALTFVTEVLGKLQLSLSETKTKVSDFNEGFEFLGFHFRNYRLGIRDKSIDRFKDRVRTLTQRHQGRNVEAILEDLNPVIRGWANYVGVAQVADLFRGLDSWIRMRIRAFKTKHRNAHDNWRLPSRKLKKWGLLSLQECRPEFRLSYVSRTVPSESKVGSLI